MAVSKLHVFIAGMENFIISSTSSLSPSFPSPPPLLLLSLLPSLPLSLSLQYILDTLALFDWDIFMPMESEEDLVNLAEDYDRQKDNNITTVAAGIVFDNTTERIASVRIRMNSTYIHDTTLIRET